MPQNALIPIWATVQMTDIVNLGDDKLNLEETRKQLEDFYYNKKSITACYYCKGRDYAFGEIDAAIQTKRPLTIAKAN